MEAHADWKLKDGEDRESWFLESLAERPVPVTNLLACLDDLAGRGLHALALEWSDLLLESLAGSGEPGPVLDVLERQAAWLQDPEAAGRCAKAADRAFKSRVGQTFIRNAGFDRGLPARECVRRLRVLFGLQVQAMCHDKTWGFGVVSKVDEFYQKLTVDFSRKAAHPMSFAYAAEALELVGDEHLLARRHKNPAALQALLREQPDEVVRIALRSYGPLTIQQLQETLTESVLGADQWKTFWDAARKALKSDPYVDIPAKRSEPLRLRARQKASGAASVEELSGEKDPQVILKKLDAMDKAEADGLPPEARLQLAERVAFALWACDRRSADLLARLLMKADSLGITSGLKTSISAGPGGAAPAKREIEVDTNQLKAAILLEEGALRLCVEELPARDAARFLAFLARGQADATCAALLKLLPELTALGLDIAVPFLAEQGREAACAAWFAETMLAPKVWGETLLWLARTPVAVERWSGLRSGDVAFRLVEWIAIGEMEGRRLHREVRDLFADHAWLEAVLATLAPNERTALVKRVQKCIGWESTGKRSALAIMIKLYPELTDAMAEGEQERGPRQRRWTSWRSYRERQAKLKELVEKTIPENSREIAHARGYGDLRENFEYQTAKDRQRLLLRRKAEMENDLDSVKGSDFAGVPTDEAGMGTTVTVRRPDGALESYCILGEWDRDEALAIISNKSKVAECLEGRRAGDAVTLPGPGGDAACTLVEVRGLSDAVKQWLAANP